MEGEYSDMKTGDKVTIKIGVYAGKTGSVEAVADAPKNIGVRVTGSKDGLLVWFIEDEIEEA